MTNLVIEKGIPIPPPLSGRKQPSRYRPELVIVKRMDVADSVLVPDSQQSDVITRLAYYRKEYGFRFVTRKEGDGTRIWRTA